MEVAYIESISDTFVLLKLEFVVSGDYFRTCKGTFCVDDYGNFPISPAKILLDTEVFFSHVSCLLLVPEFLTIPTNCNAFLQLHQARSVALSTTKGLWRSDQWGPAPNTSAQSPCRHIYLNKISNV